ncbi:MAG: HAD-IIIA family hydrolase [Thermodesulfovibrionales bacterium]|nr:HAD-IIIA family hydrolase [Thermodesulfovibrionales bacterium]
MKKTKKQLEIIARNIKLLILDVDGVMTDGGIILDNEGNELKTFHVRDGHGIKLLMNAGIGVAIISGRGSKALEKRAKDLGIKELYQKQENKIEVYERLLKKLGISDSETAFIGDEILDIPLLRRAGLPVAVSDAVEEAKGCAMMVTEKGGGKGAVREVAEFILKAKGLWDGIIGEHSKT